MRALQAATLLLLLAISNAHAQTSTPVRAGDPVPGADSLTYLDLVREIVPDITEEGSRFVGTRTIELQHADAAYDMRPPVEPNLDGGIRAVALGDTRYLLLIDLGPSDGDAANYAVLALFDAASSPHLAAALSVGWDRFSFFLTPAARSVGSGQLIATASEHSNSNQTYTITALVLLRDNRLESIDNIHTFDDATCSFKRPQQLTIEIEPSDTVFADIVATVTEHVMPTGSTCGDGNPPEASSRTITVVYEWDEAQSKYVPESDAFEILATENSKRY